ncbi:MAG TPA: efflux RND transporter periplasmic adaptor subunit [Candidatus Paceibacterota bacterium]|nr:efflux RND transporter periplasmic adaptor subunit [Candidatus Paceibacterota bacterium]HMP18899.1 efflux RND transporter periplasmic adaptor subunit [Candidatus Paceibacterota bacterium]HMP85060.1 efflux RND transporter periplasmic adaptor subunit [Candidatus Paceibacterota bacterium]
MKIHKNLKIGAIGIVLILVFIFILNNFGNKNNYKIFEVKNADLSITTQVFGRVVPAEEINLAFENTGRISVINFRIGDEVRQGDIIAKLNTAELNSEIDQAIANLESQEAKLKEITGNSGEFNNKIQSNREILLSRLKKSFILADDVVRNQIDSFIIEPNNRFPEFDASLSNFFVRKDIEEKRYQIGQMLIDWKKQVDDLSNENVSLPQSQKFIENLKQIENLLSTISTNSSDFNPTQSKTKQQIDSYLAGISQSRNSIAGAILDINNAVESLRSVEAEIPVIQANVNSARASIDRLNARSSNFVIRAPFDGVITGRHVELGVVVTAGQKAFSMISNKSLEIESFVPEINIAGVDVGDVAMVTLDAFGKDQIFETVISHIDPRETIKDGVTTYRILLNFVNFNKNILSGMSAEIEIEKEKIIDQVIIPRYLIQREDGQNYVDVMAGKIIERKKIELGQRDNKGNVIVLSGLSAGDKVVVPQ